MLRAKHLIVNQELDIDCRPTITFCYAFVKRQSQSDPNAPVGGDIWIAHLHQGEIQYAAATGLSVSGPSVRKLNCNMNVSFLIGDDPVVV